MIITPPPDILGGMKNEINELKNSLPDLQLRNEITELKISFRDLLEVVKEIKLELYSLREDDVDSWKSRRNGVRLLLDEAWNFYRWQRLDGKKDGPFCRKCWDMAGKLNSLNRRENGLYECRKCMLLFEPERKAHITPPNH